MRRNRRTAALRAMVAETELGVHRLILPLFAVEGSGVELPILSMPGCFRQSIDRLVEQARQAVDLGIPAVLLFGIPDRKDETGSAGYAPDGLIPRAVAALKAALPHLMVWTDVCLCEYTRHGHCGVLRNGDVDNDATLPLLARAACSYAAAGADMVAPSDMMDGRIGAIREALDEEGFLHTGIVSYAAKYASAFYGPFREAADSAPAQGDRRGYQMDPANSDEALREVELDLEEGADLVMVKPALSYLDIVSRVKWEFEVPVVAYSVSGEYAMLKAASRQGWIDGDRVMMEMLLSMRRAGADAIITYSALDAARLLQNGWQR